MYINKYIHLQNSNKLNLFMSMNSIHIFKPLKEVQHLPVTSNQYTIKSGKLLTFYVHLINTQLHWEVSNQICFSQDKT